MEKRWEGTVMNFHLTVDSITYIYCLLWTRRLARCYGNKRHKTGMSLVLHTLSAVSSVQQAPFFFLPTVTLRVLIPNQVFCPKAFPTSRLSHSHLQPPSPSGCWPPHLLNRQLIGLGWVVYFLAHKMWMNEPQNSTTFPSQNICPEKKMPLVAEQGGMMMSWFSTNNPESIGRQALLLLHYWTSCFLLNITDKLFKSETGTQRIIYTWAQEISVKHPGLPGLLNIIHLLWISCDSTEAYRKVCVSVAWGRSNKEGARKGQQPLEIQLIQPP